ncbi:MAG: protein kinase [Myxococcota bacterium]
MLPPPRELPEHAPRLADGRYVLLARIGRGGMAGVYAAWDTAIEEWRAVKILLPKHARDGGLRMRFEREGLTMKSLQHPNLVRVFEVGRGEKLPFLVMELINAGSLYRWTKTYGAMPARMAIEATVQLCAGVGAVHAAGVVHRDIKPRNVLINWDGVLKLTDFGIAQLGDSQETRTGLAMGTLGFMSPEQLHDAKSVDLRADIYAIGATLWSQITARKARDLFRLEDTPTLMDGVPDPIRPVLRRCLAYERDDRFPNAAELGDALSEILPSLPEDPPDAPPLPLGMGSLSVKSKPENTFSEILTTLSGEEDLASISRPPPTVEVDLVPPSSARTPVPRTSKPAGSKPAGSKPPGSKGSLYGSSSGAPSAPFTPAGRPPVPTPHTPRPSVSEGSIEVPEYMVGVEQPVDVHRPETITYRPDLADGPAAAARSTAWIRRLLLAVVAVPLVVGSLVIAGFVLTAAIGALQVRSAASGVSLAQVQLSDNLHHEEALANELEVLGASVDPLRDAYARWEKQPSEPGRSDAAVEFVLLAEQEARTRVGLGRRDHEEEIVRQRRDRVTLARAHLMGAEHAFDAAAGTAQGRLARALGLAPGEP